MNLEKLSQTEAAGLLLVDVRSVRNYLKETPPIPSRMEAGKRVYRWSEVSPWWINRRIVAATIAHPGSGQTLTPKDRLDQVKAERAEYELAQIQRKTMSIEDYEHALSEMIVPARLELLAIEPKLRSIIGAEAAAKCGAEIQRSLRRLGGEETEAA